MRQLLESARNKDPTDLAIPSGKLNKAAVPMSSEFPDVVPLAPPPARTDTVRLAEIIMIVLRPKLEAYTIPAGVAAILFGCPAIKARVDTNPLGAIERT
jgi:hypothetical protein